MATIDLTHDTFESIVGGNEIVLLDFWASWCGPCRQFAPTFEAASDQHSDIVFAKVNTEEEQQLAALAQITSIPTLMAFREGICVFSQPGALPPAALEELIGAVRGLDMEEVRQHLSEAGPAEVDVTSFAAAHAEGAFVVDVREQDEWDAGHVPGALHIPMHDVPARVAEIPQDRPVYVICQAGGRSKAITDWLRGQNYQAINVAGGTGEWAARGWALDR